MHAFAVSAANTVPIASAMSDSAEANVRAGIPVADDGYDAIAVPARRIARALRAARPNQLHAPTTMNHPM
jgi:ribosomal protein S2